jgi:hypothetical protein
MTLDLWPAFPIVVQYSLGNLSLDDRDKITAVLQQHDRICEIYLDLYHPLSEKETQILQETFPLLECLMLCSWQAVAPELPSTFSGGYAPRLRVLHLYGIAFPALPRLLSSASGLVDLLLHHIPSTGYISPGALVSGLSAAVRLKTLYLHFDSATSHSIPRNTPPPSSGRIIVFSTLMHFTFDGPSDYLEDLLSRISAPSLRHANINIGFFDQPSFDLSHLSQFLCLVESQRPPNGAHAILHLPGAFLYHTRSGARAGNLPDTSEWLSLDLTFQSRFDLSQMNQICQQISPFLSSVQTLEVHTFVRPLANVTQWLDLLRAFSSVEQLHINGRSNLDVACALQLVSAEMVADVLPALRDLTFDPVTSESREAVTSFIGAHKSAGFPAIAFH